GDDAHGLAEPFAVVLREQEVVAVGGGGGHGEPAGAHGERVGGDPLAAVRKGDLFTAANDVEARQHLDGERAGLVEFEEDGAGREREVVGGGQGAAGHILATGGGERQADDALRLGVPGDGDGSAVGFLKEDEVGG